MREKFKEHLRLLKEAPPGERFQHYHRKKREGQPLRKLLKIFAGVLSFGVALILSVTPGPAFVFYILGMALISAQFLWFAKLMDRAEVKIRKIFAKKK